jgi:release factor glutamine methyltransferase
VRTRNAATRAEALRQMTAALRAGGIDGPATDARLLLTHGLGLSAVELVTQPNVALTELEQARVAALTAQRLAHEPVSRIIGRRGFYGLEFQVTRATLDPRPDTEALVEAALAFVDETVGRSAPLRVLDVGTGTGCVLLALLVHLPAATGVGVDISAEALAVAATNATNLGVPASRVALVHGDGPAAAKGHFNVIVSNPPYIPAADIDGLAPDVRNYDPRAALDGGPDGLAFYRRWTPEMFDLLDLSHGFIGLEVGVHQASDVAGLLEAAAGLPAGRARRSLDLSQIERCVAIDTRMFSSR